MAASYIPFLPYSTPFSLIFFMSNSPAPLFCRSSDIFPADATVEEVFPLSGATEIFLAAVFCAVLFGLTLTFFGDFCATEVLAATGVRFFAAATLTLVDSFLWAISKDVALFFSFSWSFPSVYNLTFI